MPWIRPLAAAGALTATTALGMAVGALVAAKQISGPLRPQLDYAFSPFEVGLEAEDVRLVTDDGTELSAWWFEQPGATRTVICCHGHRGSKAEMLGIGPGLFRQGFNVLVFDFRGNGDSADGPQSLAHYEQQDLEAAIDWVAARRPDDELSVVGFSMGAAVAVLVAARDERVRRVVADSPFADVHGVVAYAARRMRLAPFPLVHLTDHATRLRYGYGFGDVQPEREVDQIAPRPLLILHGSEDTIIPVDHAHRMKAAAGEGCELEIIAGVDHCGGYFADRPGYIAKVADFLRR